MESLFPFFVVLVSAFLLPEVFYRFHIPWVAALMIGGILIGPFGLGIVEVDGIVASLANMGIIFLMFHVGLETKFRLTAHERSEVGWTLIVNGILPFLMLAGYMVLWDVEVSSALLLGLIGVASSVAVISPILEEFRLENQKIGKILLPSAVIMDVFPLVAVTFALEQYVSGYFSWRLVLMYSVVVPLVFVLKWIFIRSNIETFWQELIEEKEYENELKVVVALLIGMVLLFGILGIDLLLAGFFAGFLLSDTLRNQGMQRKLHTISYGVFIPSYFLHVGLSMDFPQITLNMLLFVIGVVIIVMVSKYTTGVWVGRKAELDIQEARLFGLLTIPQLTTTIALTQLGVQAELFSTEVASAMYVLVVVTSIFPPIMVEFLQRNSKKQV
jgi:Kef-type K+ transport system membrane component KefB